MSCRLEKSCSGEGFELERSSSMIAPSAFRASKARPSTKSRKLGSLRFITKFQEFTMEWFSCGSPKSVSLQSAKIITRPSMDREIDFDAEGGVEMDEDISLRTAYEFSRN